MLMDGQLKSICSDLALMQIELNYVSADEQVPEIEQHIWTVKERTRCVYNTLPTESLRRSVSVLLLPACKSTMQQTLQARIRSICSDSQRI
jgi:hypothetical protein